MRKIILLITIIIILVVILCTTNFRCANNLPQVNFPIEPAMWDGKFKVELIGKPTIAIQNEIMVYKVVYPKMSTSFVRKVAEKCKIKNIKKIHEEGCLGDGWMIMMEPDGNFDLERTPRPAKWRWDNAESQPSQQEVREVAQKFMFDKKELFAGQKWEEDFFGGNYAQEYNKKPFYRFFAIYYARKIDDLRIWGAGCRIVLHIWKDMKVGKMYMSSPEFKPLKKYPLKSIEQALVDLKTGGLKNNYIQPIDDTFKIESVQLVYYLKFLKAHQEYLQPCYLFEGKDKRGEKIEALVPAIKDEYIDKTRLDPEHY